MFQQNLFVAFAMICTIRKANKRYPGLSVSALCALGISTEKIIERSKTGKIDN